MSRKSKDTKQDSDELTSEPDFSASEAEGKISYRGSTDKQRTKKDEPKKAPKEDDPNQKMTRNMPIPVGKSNFVVRTIYTLLMLGGFVLIISAGHFYCFLLVLMLATGIFKEIITLRRNVQKEQQIPWFYTLNWYFFCVSVFFCYGKLFSSKLSRLMFTHKVLYYIINYHNFISFMLWIVGFLLFVLSLKKGFYRYQFRQFAWTHIGCLLIVGQSSVIVLNIYEGLIWFIIPCLMVICNDIFAYVFGVLFGKTRLIELSPKKTWEGFIGGFVSSLFFAVVLTALLMMIPPLICPQHEFTVVPFSYEKCEYAPHFIYHAYDLPAFVQAITGFKHYYWSDFQGHAVVMSMFASLAAPFGGFFASGFKRAIKIKDFADVIPGHGGITDRMDCQLLMGMFSYVYLHQVVLSPTNSLVSLTAYIAQLSSNDQIQLYQEL